MATEMGEAEVLAFPGGELVGPDCFVASSSLLAKFVIQRCYEREQDVLLIAWGRCGPQEPRPVDGGARDEGWIADNTLGGFADFVPDCFVGDVESMPFENSDDRFALTTVHRAGSEQLGLGVPAALVRLEAMSLQDGTD